MQKNYNMQNEKIKRIREKTLVIGVDIAKDNHYARVLNWRKIEVAKGINFGNTKEGFEKFLKWLSKVKKQEDSPDVLVAMEPTGTYYFVFEEYLERIGIEVVIVNGRDVRRTSEVMGNDSSKNDPRDALIISRLAIDGRYSESMRPKTGNYAGLRELVSLRELLEEDQIRNINRLHTLFSQIFPEYRKFKKRGISSGILSLYKELGSLNKIVQAGEEGIYSVWRQTGTTNYGRGKAHLVYEQARKSIGIRQRSQATEHKIKTLIRIYEMTQKELEDTEEKIRQQLEQMPQSKLLMEIKGIGTIITAGILSEIGDIKNYKSYKQIQKLAGYAIVSKSSGKYHGKEKSSKMGRKLLKSILFRAAIVLISTNQAFRSIYDYFTKNRNNPLIKMKAVIAIACKLIRVIYTILKTGTKYDEKKMLKDIHRPKYLTA